MENCVFCKIVRNELPSVIVYEDELVACFFDISPINPGHCILIPKEHYVSITSVPEPVLSRMMVRVPVIAQATVRAVDGDGFNLHLANHQSAGQIISHTHFHIIPRSIDDGFYWNWRSGGYNSEVEKYELAEKIVKRLASVLPLIDTP